MVSIGVLAPVAAISFQTVVPSRRTKSHPIAASHCKILGLSPGNGRALSSYMASDGVQRDSNHSGTNGNGQSVPRMEPFNQSRISRLMRQPSLLEKAEHALAERCTHLEGDEAYRCWEALFEFEDIKETYQVECDTAASDERESACRPLERFENLVRQSGGVSGLIDNIRMVAKTTRKHQESIDISSTVADKPVFPENEGQPQNPVIDQSGLLPESDLTRMLRHNGRPPAWYTHRPDHESD